MNAGLYRPEEFRDNCGFGLIAQTTGEASHRLLQTAIESLTCMTHRGGIAADGKTGDGCGLLFQMPTEFFRAQAKTLFSVELTDHFAIAQTFLSQDPDLAARERQALEQSLAAQGLSVSGWRVVPTDSGVCGEIALASLPRIEQCFIQETAAESPISLEARLLIARRKTEQALTAAEHQSFYLCSLSSKVVSYKGLVMPADLAQFYPDLNDPSLHTAICVFHQRFSTNTLPKWPLAQPFRLLAHNGEINTIEGNRNWAEARAALFETDSLPNIAEIQPIVNRTGSDSSSLDNMLEVLLTGGVDMPRALRMLIPPAWQNLEGMDPDLRAFYEYHSMHMELGMVQLA